MSVSLNQLSTCSQYGHCMRHIVPSLIFCWTRIPRKYSFSPTSFISHSFPISSFLFSTSPFDFDAPKTSSVYVSVRVYPLFSFLYLTQGSAREVVYPNLSYVFVRVSYQ